jgi:V/A-type H+-transporting ATPase subunit C
VDHILLLGIASAAAGLIAVAKFGPSLVVVAGFTYPNAKFNAIGTPFLYEKELTKLIASSSLQDLQNNVVSKDFSVEGETIQDMQRSVDNSLVRIIAMGRQDSPKNVRAFYEAFLQLFDARLLKDVAQVALTGMDMPHHLAFSKLGSKIQHSVIDGDMETFLEILTDLGMDEVRDHLVRKASLPAIEYAIDRFLIGSLKQAQVARTCVRSRDIFVKYFIDVMNLKAIFRTKYYRLTGVENIGFGEGREISRWQLDHLLTIDSIPEIISLLEGTSYGVSLRDVISEYEVEGITALEMVLDSTLLRLVGDISMQDPMGLGPGIRFLMEKWYEARNLKAIIKGIGEGLDAEMIWRVVIQA